MLSNPVSSGLSSRGAVASETPVTRPIWDILKDLWHFETNPQGFVNLGVAENALMHADMKEHINRKFFLDTQGLTYGESSIGSKRLRAVLADFFNRYLAPTTAIRSDHIVVTNGVCTAIVASAWALCNEGDGILLGRPFYGSFPIDFNARAGVNTVAVTFGDVDPFSLEAVRTYEEALLVSESQGIKVKGLMLCSPHNPLGNCYSRETIVALMRLCQKYNIHFISDEIYALSVWHNDENPNATTFTSALSIDMENVINPSLVHVLWGLSKDFCANGLRLGCVISQNNPLFLKAISRNGIFRYPSSPSDAIAVSLLSDYTFVDWFTSTNKSRIAESYKFATSLLRANGIPYYNKSNAAFFLWIDLKTLFVEMGRRSPLQSENCTLPTGDDAAISREIMSRLLEKKVFLASGEAFGGERPGWFRLVFTQPRSLVAEGISRIMEALAV